MLKKKRRKQPVPPLLRDGRIIVVVGSTGSGKSQWVRQQIKTAPRLWVWDVKPEYHALRGTLIVRTRAHLLALAQVEIKQRVLFVVPPTPANFEWWARCAYLAARIKPITVVAEEIADVTSPGKAPLHWGQLVRKVRATGSDLYAITQRPAESDKTAIGNASLFHVGRISRKKDRVYMAAELDIKESALAALTSDETGAYYIEKNTLNLKITRGRITFKK